VDNASDELCCTKMLSMAAAPIARMIAMTDPDLTSSIHHAV